MTRIVCLPRTSSVRRFLPPSLLIGVLTLAAALRFWRLGAISFTFDSAAVSNLAAGLVDHGKVPLQGMVSSTGANNPPLFVYLMSLPVLLSRDPLVLTAFVIVLNLAGVAGTFWLGWRYWGSLVGLIAATLFAASPWAVQHSRGVLGQDLLAPGAVLLFGLLFIWFVDGKKWALPAAMVTLSALTQVHFAAFAFVPLLVVLGVWELIRRPREPHRLWLYSTLGLALAALLYLPYLVGDALNDWHNLRQLSSVVQGGSGLHWQVFDLALMNVGGRNLHALVGPTRFQEFLKGVGHATYLPDRLEEVAVLLALVYLGYGWLRRQAGGANTRRDGLLILWVVVPLLFFLVSRSEVQLHYLNVLYPAPYLVLGTGVAALVAGLRHLAAVRKWLLAAGGILAAALLTWQCYLLTSAFNFIDIHATPDGWPTPARIQRAVIRNMQEYAALDDAAQVIVLCDGVVPEWDECPAVFTFLASRGPDITIIDYNDPQLRVHQEDPETLFVLVPGDSLAAHDLPLWAQPLPQADTPLREDSAAYQFFRVHNYYQDIAQYLYRDAPSDAGVVLVGVAQRAALDRFYSGNLPVYELPLQPADPAATMAELERLVDKHSRLFGIYRAPQDVDPEGIVDGWLRAHTYASGDTWLGPSRLAIYTTVSATEKWLVNRPELPFDDQIALREVALSADQVTSGDLLAVQLVWRVLTRSAVDYSVFVQLLDADGQVRAQRDLPLRENEAPSVSWEAGVEAQTRVALVITPGTPPGDHTLIAGLYDPATGARLTVANTDHVQLAHITILPPAQPVIGILSGVRFHPHFDFGSISLVGFDRYKRGFWYQPDTALVPGDTVRLVFEWRSNGQPSSDWLFTARLRSPAGQPVTAVSAPLAGPRYQTSSWSAGELVRGEHDLPLPVSLAPARYRLEIMVHQDGQTVRGGWTSLGNIVVR